MPQAGEMEGVAIVMIIAAIKLGKQLDSVVFVLVMTL
jgi:hypothetical protein